MPRMDQYAAHFADKLAAARKRIAELEAALRELLDAFNPEPRVSTRLTIWGRAAMALDGTPDQDATAEAAEEPMPIADVEADRIAARVTKFNCPAPDKPGMRMVGWYVPEDQIGLGTALLALDRIALAWRNWREIGTRELR